MERDIDLVYGGGSIGLMGLVSQAVYNGGRHVIGLASSLFFFLFTFVKVKIKKISTINNFTKEEEEDGLVVKTFFLFYYNNVYF